MSYEIRGSNIMIPSGGKITGADIQKAAKDMGIQLPANVTEATREYTQDEVNAIIMQYANTRNAISTMWRNATGTTKEQVIAELKAKYGTNEPVTGDIYKMTNPQMVQFQKMLNDGVIAELGQTFNRNDIVDIINAVFPKIGISRTNNGDEFKVPYGHDAGAREVYKEFITQISKAIGNSSEITGLENEISQLTNEINNNIRTIKLLANQIQELQEHINQVIDKAIQDSKDLEEKAKSDAKKAVREELDKYKNSNGTMTYAQFRKNLNSRLAQINPNSEMAAIADKISDAAAEMDSLKNLVSRIADLNNKNAALRVTLGEKNAELARLRAELEAQAQQATQDDVQRTDPIGFTTADGMKVDFFIDKDSDGLLSNEQEFLGAVNGWAELTALDVNGDGLVSFDEMKDLKVVMTDASGQQTVGNVGDVLKEGDSIDLNSFRSAGTVDANNNILAGTFNLNVNGQTLNTGTQTFDTLSWLDQKYNFSDRTNGIGRFAQGQIAGMDAEEIFASQFDSLINELSSKLTAAANQIQSIFAGIPSAVQGAFDSTAQAEADAIRTESERYDRDPDVDPSQVETLADNKNDYLNKILQKAKQFIGTTGKMNFAQFKAFVSKYGIRYSDTELRKVFDKLAGLKFGDPDHIDARGLAMLLVMVDAKMDYYVHNTNYPSIRDAVDGKFTYGQMQDIIEQIARGNGQMDDVLNSLYGPLFGS